MGEDIRDWRVQFLGKRFASFQIQQATQTQVLAAQAITSTTGALTPITTNWEGYRALQFTADQPAGLTLTTPQGLTKSWAWQTVAGSPTVVTLDLCSPQSWNQNSGTLPDADDRASRYPLDASGHFPDEISQGEFDDGSGFHHDGKGALYGVFEVATLEFTGVGTGQTLHLGSMNLICQNQASVTFRPTFGANQLYQIGQTQLIQPMTRLCSDEKGFTDAPAACHFPGASWSDTTLTQLIADTNAIPGWMATPASSFPDSVWHNNSGPANWAWAGGMVWDGTQWINGSFVAVGQNPLAVDAQPLYDEVSAYPGAGDVWSGAGYDPQNPEIPLYAVKILRGAANGRVFGSASGLPVAGQAITTNPASGSALTDSQGGYVTGAPFGKGNLAISTQANGPGGPLAESMTWQNRGSVQLSFRLKSGGENPRLLEGETGGYWLSTLSGQILQIDHSSLAFPPKMSSTSHPELGALATARLAEDADGGLWLATITPSNAGQLYRSFDSGQSFAAWPNFTMTSQLCDIRCAPHGTLMALWLSPLAGNSGPSHLMGRSKPGGAPDFSSPVTLTDATGTALVSDGNGFGFDCAREGANRWFLTFTVSGESAPSIWSSADEGLTWRRVS